MRYLMMSSLILVSLLGTVVSAYPAGGNSSSNAATNESLERFLYRQGGYDVPYDYDFYIRDSTHHYDHLHNDWDNHQLEPFPSREDQYWKPVKYSIYFPHRDTYHSAEINYRNHALHPEVFTPQKHRQRHEGRLKAWQQGYYVGREGDFYAAEHNDNILTKAMRHVSTYQDGSSQEGFLYLPEHNKVYYTPEFNYKVAKGRHSKDDVRPMARLVKDSNCLWQFTKDPSA